MSLNREINKLRQLGLVPNTLHDILEAFPPSGDKPYDYLILSQNQNLRFDYVLKHMDKQWFWVLLNKYMIVTLKDIEEYPNLREANPERICIPWNYHILTHNPNLPVSDVMDILDKIEILPESTVDRIILSNNNIITSFDTVETVEEKYDNPIESGSTLLYQLIPGFQFDSHKTLSQNVNNNLDLISRSERKDEFWNYVSRSSYLTLKDIIDNPNWELWPKYMTQSPNIRIQDIIKHPEIAWDFEFILKNPNITVEDIRNNPHFPWNSKYIPLNKFETHPVVAKRYIDKYKSRSTDKEFMTHLKIWKDRLKYRPGGEGYIKTKQSWDEKV